MKKLLFFLVFFSCTTVLKAQKWAPMGAQWTYMYDDTISDYKPPVPTRWVADDTVRINGKWCTLIHSHNHIKPFDSVYAVLASRFSYDFMAIYEDSGRVYWYNWKKNNFTVLYDFNKIVGENWIVATPYCDVTVTVQKTGIDTINGIPLRSMLIKGGYVSSAFSGKVIEYIGYLKAPRPIYPYACSSPTDLGIEFDTLRCYQDDYIGFVDFKTAPYCDYVKTSIAEHTKEKPWHIAPNPSNGNFDIIYPSGQGTASPQSARVYDVLGHIVYQSPLQLLNNRATVHLNLPSGTYFLVLQDQEAPLQRERIWIQ